MGAADTVWHLQWHLVTGQHWRIGLQYLLSNPERTGGAKAVFQLQWLVHIMAESSDRGRDAVERYGGYGGAAAITKETTNLQRHESAPPYLPITCPASAVMVAVEVLDQSLQWQVVKGQKQLSSLSGQYTLRHNPMEKTKSQKCKLTSPYLALPNPLHGISETARTPQIVHLRLAASGCRKVVLGIYRPGAPLPATSHQGCGVLRQRQPSHRGPPTLGIWGIFYGQTIHHE